MTTETELTNPQAISQDEREYQMNLLTRPAIDQRQGKGAPPFLRVEMTQEDWGIQEAIAQERMRTAQQQRRRDVYRKRKGDLDPHQVGVFGEYLVAKVLGVPFSEIYVNGMSQDYAFRFELGKIAVKTTLHIEGSLAMKAHKSNPPNADFFVLCSKRPGDRLGGNIDGFCGREEWMQNRVTNNQNVEWPYYTYKMHLLRPFYQLVLMLVGSPYISLAQDTERQGRG